MRETDTIFARQGTEEALTHLGPFVHAMEDRSVHFVMHIVQSTSAAFNRRKDPVVQLRSMQ